MGAFDLACHDDSIHGSHIIVLWLMSYFQWLLNLDQWFPLCHSSHGSKYLETSKGHLSFCLIDCLIGNLLSKVYLPPMFVLPTHPLNEGYDKGTHRSKAVGILLAILWGRWTSDCPQEDFAKFGYWLEKKQILFFEPHAWHMVVVDIQEPMVYIYGDFNFCFLGIIWQLWAIFFPSTKKTFVQLSIDYRERKGISDRYVMECHKTPK
jgi:hypothetical protein